MDLIPQPGRLRFGLLLPLIDYLLAHGLDKATLLHESGIDVDAEGLADQIIDGDDVGALLDTLGRITGRTDLSFEAGLAMRPALLGPIGLASMSSRNYADVYQLYARFFHTASELVSVRSRRTRPDGDLVVSITPLISTPPRLLRHLIESAATCTHRQMLYVLGAPLPAYDLEIAMPPPPHQARYAELAPARVTFVDDAVPGLTIRLPAELADRPLPMASPRILAQMEARLQPRTRRLPAGAHWGGYVMTMLRESRGQLPTIEQLAQRLGVTARTIDRRLAAEGLSFRAMSRGVRLERARELLAQPGATVAQVADTLGFGDAASFSRAFRRGAGMAPGEYQRWQRQGGAQGAGAASGPAEDRDQDQDQDGTDESEG